MNMYSEFTVTVAVPAVGLLLIYLCYRGWLSFINQKMAKAVGAAETDAELAQQPEKGDEMEAREARDRAVWLAIGWLFLVYTILCRTTFSSFACQEIDDGESFHRTDYSIDCNSNSYKAYAVVAACFLAIYPVGIPAFFGLLLYRNRRVLGKHVSGGQNVEAWWYGDSETLDFLVDGYRPDTFWFEEVEFLRKLLMAGVPAIWPYFEILRRLQNSLWNKMRIKLRLV
jgi:hypothetical protein